VAPHFTLGQFACKQGGAEWPKFVALRPALFVKRDDCTGLGLGGNKIRKLEFGLAAAVAAGAERAAGSAARCLTPEILGAALRHLHRPALDPALGRSLRGQRGLLEDVRQRAAQAVSIDLPQLAEPRRVSWPTLIMIIGTLIGDLFKADRLAEAKFHEIDVRAQTGVGSEVSPVAV